MGPLHFSVPALAWGGRAETEVDPSSFPLSILPGEEVALGHRSLDLTSGEGRLSIRFPVPAPEVSGVPGSIAPAGADMWFLHWPPPEDAWAELQHAKPALVILGNARVLFAEGEPFVRAVREIRGRLGAGPLLWAPRVALPHRLAFLTYVGCDLLDTTEAVGRSRTGEYFDATLGTLPPGASRAAQLCDCAQCTGSSTSPDPHVARQFAREAALVRVSLRSDRLRELVEARLTAEPALSELLRYADRLLGPALEVATPVVGTGKRGYVLRESQRRPEVLRFLARFVARYRPPPSKRILLVLPCSRTKPYRASPSHRKYLRALERIRAPERVHVVSVTSPIGVVPRELEDVYPARHYDIPVTGEWDEWERNTVVTGLQHLLRSHAYETVLLHLDPSEYGFLRGRIETSAPVHWTAPSDRTLSPEALDSLANTLDEASRESTPVQGGVLSVVREELHEVAAYQFGRTAADHLFTPPVRLMGRPWFQRLTDGKGTDLATWREERGLFQLTVAGGERLLGSRPLAVEVAEDVSLSGDLFTPGVRSADPSIRVGDAVLLTRDEKLLGVGEAVLPGPLMEQLPRGKAVEVRHHVRSPRAAPSDTDLTEKTLPR